MCRARYGLWSMARRKQLKGLAAGICGSFISRNNDINGYWAVGRLYSNAVDNDLEKVELDLKNRKCVPNTELANLVLTRYNEYMFTQLKKMGLKQSQITSATIGVEFNLAADQQVVPAKLTWGEPFCCTVTLTDDLGNVWQDKSISWCGLHDPNKEMRSTRA